MINEYLDPNYLASIKSKLDAMNKANGFDPNLKQGQAYGEYRIPDMMGQIGDTGIAYLKSIGKNPNLSDIEPTKLDEPPTLLFS